ncbi:MAG TPA: lipoate--protein ligase family protein [Oscillatoriales cyanobacterium M59_W2019_021]|nr:lipoate--protein ligase family protein [Oscillatoriales cyanobacterium M4454_W2019_049]HIK52633.1 lipoate--protein ligase family protein [Oscillatoriales cyanobacterium M59_W2019_021]
MQNLWRLIPPLSAPGPVQMAIDRWLLAQYRSGWHPPTLRFYTWSPPAISLGYHQQRWPSHWENLTWWGQPVELVRRPTGGRAVLHQGDLTYAVVTSGGGRQRMQSYRAICEFLIAGWRSLGVELHYGGEGDYTRSPDCFATATSADLVDPMGAKFVGSAQLRQGTAILQHGSMRLAQDAALFERVFGGGWTPVTLPDAVRGAGAIEVVVEALTASACQCFGASFSVQPLSEAEWQGVYRHLPCPRESQLTPEVRAGENRAGDGQGYREH